jgi:hypothetical protein
MTLLPCLIALLPSLAGAQEPPSPFVVSLGALECEFTASHLDIIRWRDQPVIGDAFSDPRPTVQPYLLKRGWGRLAGLNSGETRAPQVERSDDRVVVRLGGVAAEDNDGPGRWQWQQTWTFTRAGVLSLDYHLHQLTAPREEWWLHRLQLIGNRNELFVRPPTADQKPPGKPVPIHTRDGQDVSPPFGGEGNVVRAPETVRLPYAGHEVILRPDASARSVELWNAWWRQCVNFEWPVGPDVTTHFEIDLSDLPQIPDPTLTVAPVLQETQPWLTEDIPPLPPVERTLRFAQNTPGVIAWDKVRAHSEEELETFFAEMAPHFDVMELGVAWTDWKWDLNWETNAAARAHAEGIAAEVQKQVRIAGKHGIKIALSLNFGGAGPGVGNAETARQPQFQGETFDPLTGEFRKAPRFFDWGSAQAVESARRAFADCARLVGSVGYLFFNEPHWSVGTWYELPLFSEAALADFRRFTGDAQARFPAKPWAVDSPRTDNHAGAQDWARWLDWVQACFAHSIQVQAEGFARANAQNPQYGGAIYFQNVDWVGPKYAVDLDRIATLPEITWLCAEYVTNANAPAWKRFKYVAQKHHKQLSSFVNIGYYDSASPGRVRYQGTDAAFESAVRMGLEERVPMITLYPAESLNSASPGFSKTRTEIWDRLTAPGK